MASINEKLNYINETKSLIKDKLNDLGSEIDNETTFREYAEKIEDLYNEWPKINDEDTTITLNNTKKGKINLQLKGNSSQNSTKGYQLINQPKTDFYTVLNGITFESKTDGTFYIHGTATANMQRIIDISDGSFKTPSPTSYTSFNAGDYIINPITISGTPINLRIRKASDNLIVINGSSASFTVDEDGSLINIYLYIGNNTVVDYKFKLMLEKGTVSHIWEPYTGENISPNPNYPQNIKVATGENIITISNKNDIQSQIFNINLGDLELHKIENSQDYFYTENEDWYLHKEIEKINLNDYIFSIDSVTIGGINYSQYASSNSTPVPLMASLFSTNILSNYLKGKDNETSLPIEQQKNTIYINSSRRMVVVAPELNGEYITTIEDFNTFKTDVVLYGKAYQPTNIKITYQPLIDQLNNIKNALSYNEQTNISQTNNDLPFIINATALMKNSD